VSLRKNGFLLIFRTAAAAAALLAALPALAQYPGQIKKPGKETPKLRSVAVLEWTGEPGSPKASRLVPVAVLDGDDLQDGGLYLARPQPMALAGGVEYELQQNGAPLGLYDILNSGQVQGTWVGFGAWKPLAAPRPRQPSISEVARTGFDPDDDKPVLHRKKHAGDAPAAGAGKDGPGSSAGSAGSSEPSDPDRPTLHKKPADAPQVAAASAPDALPDPDRPTLHKERKKTSELGGQADTMPAVTDPDRPLLKRGKFAGNGLEVLPTLMGMPAEMQQAVAVSDARSRPEHSWTFSWSNPEDEDKMKSALEEIARDALGLKPPLLLQAPKKPTARKAAKSAPLPLPLPLLPLVDENFRVFELAYGSGATLVLSARTDGSAAEQRFVTLVAQPDLYGNVLVLLKSVTDGAHLDDRPRMHLVDAVDAMADNRGELLFELRGATQRQFALYRVLRGRAEKLFVTGPLEMAQASRD